MYYKQFIYTCNGVLLVGASQVKLFSVISFDSLTKTKISGGKAATEHHGCVCTCVNYA